MKSILRRALVGSACLAIAVGIKAFSNDSLLAKTVNLVQSRSARPAEVSMLQNERSLFIEDYDIQHQGEHRLSLAIRCVYKPEFSSSTSPESSTIYQKITAFLADYPNETDYWEIVNRKLTESVLKSYPSLASVTINLKVFPSSKEAYTRSTTVTYTADGKLLESWSFITTQLFYPHRGGHQLNITTEYFYQDGIADSDYPDFIPIHHRINQFLEDYPNHDASWELLNRQLANTIIKEYPVMKSFTSKIEVMPTADSPYRYLTSLTLKK